MIGEGSYRSASARTGRRRSRHRTAAVARPPDGLIATDATRRLLWGVLTGGVAWLAVALAGGTLAAVVAWITATAVALLDLPGIAVAAAATAAATGQQHAPARALTVALIVTCAAAALGGPAVRIAQRCGGLAPGALLVAATLGALAIGPAAGLAAPVAVAAVQALLQRQAP